LQISENITYIIWDRYTQALKRIGHFNVKYHVDMSILKEFSRSQAVMNAVKVVMFWKWCKIVT